MPVVSLNRERRRRGMLCGSRRARNRYGVGRALRSAASRTAAARCLQDQPAEQYATQ